MAELTEKQIIDEVKAIYAVTKIDTQAKYIERCDYRGLGNKTIEQLKALCIQFVDSINEIIRMIAEKDAYVDLGKREKEEVDDMNVQLFRLKEKLTACRTEIEYRKAKIIVRPIDAVKEITEPINDIGRIG